MNVHIWAIMVQGCQLWESVDRTFGPPGTDIASNTNYPCSATILRQGSYSVEFRRAVKNGESTIHGGSLTSPVHSRLRFRNSRV
jgi:hypothetical protein